MALAREAPQSFGEALKVAAEILERNLELLEKGLARTEAEQIVRAAYRMTSGKPLSRAELFLKAKDRLSLATAERVLIFAAARAEGKLLQHIIGSQAFLDHEYDVGPGVLVPRPETEVLVRVAISELERRSRPPGIGIEIGVGSGAVSIELLAKFPGLTLRASDVSPLALEVTRRNAERILGADDSRKRLALLRAHGRWDVFEPFPPKQTADFIISNPPYLAGAEEAEGDVVQQEPHEALFAPPEDPMYFYRKIAEEGLHHLGPGGMVFVEIPHERSRLAEEIFQRAGYNPVVIRDLTGRDRVLVAGPV